MATFILILTPPIALAVAYGLLRHRQLKRLLASGKATTEEIVKLISE